MRENNSILCGEIIKRISDPKIHNENVANSKIITSINKPTKNQLWKSFIVHFENLYGKKLDVDDEFIENIKLLFLYFLQDEDFINCNNLRGGISNPSFDKGLLVIGSFGLGKTDFFKVFESMFKNHAPYRFKVYSSKELVRQFETLQTPKDKEYFYKEMERKRMFIDDLNSEKMASNYGLTDVIGEIISLRYEKNLLTFASCNYSSNDNCVEQTLIQLGQRYGGRIYDRLFEMFNVIEFKGKSKRI